MRESYLVELQVRGRRHCNLERGYAFLVYYQRMLVEKRKSFGEGISLGQLYRTQSALSRIYQ